MNRKLTFLPFFLTSCLLFGCTDNSSEKKAYVVTWLNDNGEVLERDNEVLEGSMPSFDGDDPTKEGNEQYSYTFSGWDKELTPVTSDTTYTATYASTVNAYTVTWVNYDESILEVDENVPYGSMPKFDGNEPSRPQDGDVTYTFNGWSPAISKVKGDITYKATFLSSTSGEEIEGSIPTLSKDNKYVTYGLYPQSHVKDETLLSELDALTSSSVNDWYLFNGNYYKKVTSSTYKGIAEYTFDDGDTIVNGASYWFKCEPIKWRILSLDSGVYTLLSDSLLDYAGVYQESSDSSIEGEKTIYPSSYQNSNVIDKLDFFVNEAFALNSTYLKETIIKNDASTTSSSENKYICDSDMKVKSYLLSYQDYVNTAYGFTNDGGVSSSRQALTTDYARSIGSWINYQDTQNSDLKMAGTYLTRSPSSEYSYAVNVISSVGAIRSYAVNNEGHSLRPAINIAF